MKRILITGGSGFIGSHIAEYFNGKAEIRILDNLRSGYRRNLDGLDVEFIEGDVRDRAAVARAVEGCDHVFHLAAMVSVPESMFKIEECVDINVNGLLVVLEESAKAGVEKLCFSSSAAIRAGRAKITPPMVGMPCLTLCDCGPSSLMVWPNFIRLSQGIKIGPSANAMTKAANTV